MENAIVQLNKYPKDKYNVLVPVTTMQVASCLLYTSDAADEL